MLIRDGVVDSPPFGDRSSVGIMPEGALDVRRVDFFGTWKGLGQRRAVNDLNQPLGANGISLFTPSYGPTTPAGGRGDRGRDRPVSAGHARTGPVGPVSR